MDPVRKRIPRVEYEAVVQRVQDRISFYAHFTWYFWLNLMFVTLNLALTPETWWSLGVALFWAMGLLSHLVATFFIGDLEGPFRERMLRRELGRRGARRGSP